MPRCTRCGAENPENRKWCVHCMKPLGENPAAAKPAAESPAAPRQQSTSRLRGTLRSGSTPPSAQTRTPERQPGQTQSRNPGQQEIPTVQSPQARNTPPIPRQITPETGSRLSGTLGQARRVQKNPPQPTQNPPPQTNPRPAAPKQCRPEDHPGVPSGRGSAGGPARSAHRPPRTESSPVRKKRKKAPGASGGRTSRNRSRRSFPWKAAAIAAAAVLVLVLLIGGIIFLVNNRNLIRLDSESIGTLRADNTCFPVDSENTICFELITDSCEADKICLYKAGEDAYAGILLDDGEGCDKTADDGVYSCLLYPESNDSGSISYQARLSDTETSNEIQLYFFETPSREDAGAQLQQIRTDIQDIESEFTDNGGFVPEEEISQALSAVENYAQRMLDSGELVYYESCDSSVVMKMSTGLSYAYIPLREDVDSSSSGDSLDIITMQPCLDTYSGEILRLMHLPDEAAALAEDLPNAAFTGNYDNREVTLAQIKNFTTNQVVLWHGHGGFSDSLHAYLLTGEAFDEAAWWWDPVYFLDCVQNRIVECSNGNVAITSKFIDRYCGDLSGSMFYLAACCSGKDNVLADAFLNKGASAVVANSETIYTEYNIQMLNATIRNMAAVDEQTRQCPTLLEALKAAKDEFGADDEAYGPKQEVATPLIFGGPEADDYRLCEEKLPAPAEQERMKKPLTQVKYTANGGPMDNYYLSQTYYLHYDENQRLTSVQFMEGSMSTTLTYTYDSLGRLTDVDCGNFWLYFTNAEFRYDSAGNLSRRASHWGGGENSWQQAYEYDDRNNLILVRELYENGDSNTIGSYTYVYDPQGRVLERHAQEDSISPDTRVETPYGTYPRSDCVGVTQYSYDSAGRLSQEYAIYLPREKYQPQGNPVPESESTGVVSYHYDYPQFLLVQGEGPYYHLQRDADAASASGGGSLNGYRIEFLDTAGNTVWSLDLGNCQLITDEEGYLVKTIDSEAGYTCELTYGEEISDQEFQKTVRTEQYKYILRSYPEEDDYFRPVYTLYDIDKDGLEELIVQAGGNEYHVYTFENNYLQKCASLHGYSSGLYACEGNGLALHSGGHGYLHLEQVYLYTLENGTMEMTQTLADTEVDSYDDLQKCLDQLEPIRDFRAITDFSLILEE